MGFVQLAGLQKTVEHANFQKLLECLMTSLFDGILMKFLVLGVPGIFKSSFEPTKVQLRSTIE